MLALAVLALGCGLRADTDRESAAADRVRRLMRETPPDKLASDLLADPALIAPTLEPLAAALMDRSVDGLEDYLVSVARAGAARLARRGADVGVDELDLELTLQLVHPRRFVEEPEFRERVGAMLPRAFDPALPAALRDALLVELNRVQGVDFELSERVEVGWGASRRESSSRRDPSALITVADSFGPIEATVLSLPTAYVDPTEAEALVAALEAAAPARDLLVLTDGAVRAGLAAARRAPRTYLLETYGRPYTPWPRDPLLFGRRPDGGVLLIERPNLQRGREADAFLARELIQQLPAEVDERWGGARWAVARVPFHNGQVLATATEAWTSLHGLEEAILARLGLDRVPVASFATVDGVERYAAAARQSAEELGGLFGRPVRFVHPLPTSGPAAEREAFLSRLGGGAGFDLDSLLTLLPGSDGSPTVALVGDIDPGAALLSRISEDQRRRFVEIYRLREPVAATWAEISRYQTAPRARALDGFLEIVAAHLGAAGLEVERLPLLLVPRSALAEHGAHGSEAPRIPDFLIGWNNVVVEIAAGARRAAGFESGLSTGDAAAARTFAAGGTTLHLLPTLRGSVVNNGGYRCASNHLRARASAP